MPATIADFSTNIKNPSGIAVDSSNNVYVAARGQQSVLRIPSASTGVGGTPVVVAGGQEPTAVAVDASGNIFTVYADQVVLFKNGQAFAVSEKIKSPVALAVDTSGNIYISCAGNNRIVFVSAT